MATTTHITRPTMIERSPVFYGWVIWGIALIGLMATSPGQAYSLSLFIDHYITDFGISRTLISTLFSGGTFIAAMLLTWVGRRIDINGNRNVGIVVIILYTAVMLSLSLLNGPLMLLLSFIALRLFGMGSLFLVSSTAIAQWWRVRRGWVAGLALVGFALSQRIYMPAVENLINTVGWRTTWIILGLVVGLTVTPLWWLFMRDRPERYGLLPDNASKPAADTPEVIDAEDNWTLAEARCLPIFWIFVFGRMFVSAIGSGLIFHQVSIFAQLGHSAETTAMTYGSIAVVNAMTTLVVGRNIWRIRRPGYIMAVQLMLVIASLYLSMVMSASWMLSVYAILFGMVMSLGGLFENTVWADLFGRLHHGAIRGFVTTALVTGTAIGPILFGFSYDHFGSYDAIRWVGIGLAFIPLVLSLTVKRPRFHEIPAIA